VVEPLLSDRAVNSLAIRDRGWSRIVAFSKRDCLFNIFFFCTSQVDNRLEGAVDSYNILIEQMDGVFITTPVDGRTQEAADEITPSQGDALPLDSMVEEVKLG